MNKIKKIAIITSILILGIVMLVGCNKGESVEDVISRYSKLLNESNYEALYENIAKESKESITKEEFVKLYQNRYSAIDANNIKITPQSTEDTKDISIVLTMDTIAGKLKSEPIKINLVKEDKSYKLVWDESLMIPGMQVGDKVRVKIEEGTRGRILDRDGNKLAYNGDVNTVGIDPKVFEENKEDKINQMAEILDISKEFIEGKLEANKNPEHLVPIVKVSIYEQEKVDAVELIEGVRVGYSTSRVYIQGEAFGNLIGYIDEIKADELEKYKNKGYHSGSKVGKKGIEEQYEDTLRSIDGAHIYLERGNEEITIAKKDTINGKDIKLAIDSELQKDIYSQMNYEKGASIAMDPKSGEVLAMVSSPSYDSNTYSTYRTKSIVAKWEENGGTQGLNRANKTYSPGSTMKLITAAIGLENGIIEPNKELDIKGTTWQKDTTWGEYYITRVKNPNKPVNLYDATKYSDNIYYAQTALSIGKDKFIEGAKQFGIGEEVPFEFPINKSQISTNGKLDNEILLADTGYGQGEVLMTPLNVTMAYSALGNEGKIMTPRLVISENSEAKVYKQAIKPENLSELVKAFSGVINDSDGSGSLAKVEGVNLAGKTGTAEIKKSKDDTNGSEHSWFVAVDTDNSSIAVSMILEDSKGKSTSKYVVPMVGKIVKNYINN